MQQSTVQNARLQPQKELTAALQDSKKKAAELTGQTGSYSVLVPAMLCRAMHCQQCIACSIKNTTRLQQSA